MNSTGKSVANRFRQPAPADALRAFQSEIIDRLNTPLPPDSPAPSLMICVGPSDPEALRAIRAQLPPTVLLVWVSPPPASVELAAGLLAAARPARAVICELDPDGHYLDKVGLAVAMLPDLTVQLNAVSAFRETHRFELATLDREIRQIRENIAQNHSRGIFRLRCSLQNIHSMARNRARELTPLLEPGSAIICGAGPSLMADLERLRETRGRALLIAVGHAVPGLLRYGIEPDVVVEIDCLCGRNWPDDVRPTGLLVAAADVTPSVAARFERVLWFQGSSSEANVLVARLGLCLPELHLGRSVTVSAIELALKLNCRRIALVGQDFALSADAATHFGDAATQTDGVVDVPGADGGMVQATGNLRHIREALEDYLASVAIPHWPDAEISNCSARGAKIEGTRRDSLDAWVRSLPAEAAFSIVQGEPFHDFPMGTLSRLPELLDGCRAACDAILAACRALSQQLSAGTFDAERVKHLQMELGQQIQREASLQQDEALRILLSPAVQYAERAVRVINGLDLNSQDPFIQMVILSVRYRMVRDLAGDLRDDLRAVAAAMATRAPTVSAGAPTHVGAFRAFGVAMLKQGSPALAAWMEAHPDAAPDERFRVTVMNQTLAYVHYRTEEGAWQPLSGFLSMHEEARHELEAFLAGSNYDPKRHALVIAGPGNWSYPYEFARLHPAAALCVLEPWPELLSALMSSGCFLHVLHPRTLVIAAGEGCEAALAAAIEGWRTAGRTPLLFVPRRLQGIHDVEALARLVHSRGAEA